MLFIAHCYDYVVVKICTRGLLGGGGGNDTVQLSVYEKFIRVFPCRVFRCIPGTN